MSAPLNYVKTTRYSLPCSNTLFLGSGAAVLLQRSLFCATYINLHLLVLSVGRDFCRVSIVCGTAAMRDGFPLKGWHSGVTLPRRLEGCILFFSRA